MGPLPGIFINARRQRLHTVKYATRGKPGAVLIIHHGLAEHSGRYEKVCKLLSDNGVEVHAYDAHGHGKSEPLGEADRAFIQSYTHLVDDMCDFMDSVQRQQQPQPSPEGGHGHEHERGQRPAPLFLLGHSMGGLVAALACVRKQDHVAGVMLHSPALDVEWTPMLRAQALVGGLMAALLPRAKVVPAVRPEDMSQDPAVVADYVNDPLNTVGPIRARTGNEMLRGFAEISRLAPELRLPVYVCHGSKDACTNAAASRRFVEGPGGVSSVDRTFRSVEGGYHELLHGPEWEACTRELLSWMRARGADGGGGDVGGVGAGAGASPRL